MSEQKSIKKRNWAFVLYPDSAPSNWRDALKTSGLPCAVSPLHDKDMNEDGSKKKPHYHVILIYGSPTTFSNVSNLTVSQLKGTIPQPLEQVRGYYRYLTHLDNPEKYQYSPDDILCLNGFDIRDFVEISKSEVLTIKRRLQALIREQNFVEYSDFMDYIDENGTQDEYDVACNNTLFFDRYLSSRRNKAKGMAFDVDPDTGEVLNVKQ